MKAAARERRSAVRGVLPGFGLSTGVTVLYLCAVVLIPLSTLAGRQSALSWGEAWRIVASPRALGSYRLSFGASLAAAGVNVAFGVLVAWVLARYAFPGRSLVDAVVDLPFALPTAVAGIALTAVYARNGWIGRWLEPLHGGREHQTAVAEHAQATGRLQAVGVRPQLEHLVEMRRIAGS